MIAEPKSQALVSFVSMGLNQVGLHYIVSKKLEKMQFLIKKQYASMVKIHAETFASWILTGKTFIFGSLSEEGAL